MSMRRPVIALIVALTLTAPVSAQAQGETFVFELTMVSCEAPNDARGAESTSYRAI